MGEYEKRVTGVTSVLTRKAHGNNKIHHDAWNDELRDEPSQYSTNGKQSDMESTISIFSLFPWWVNFTLAVASCFFLHQYADLNAGINAASNSYSSGMINISAIEENRKAVYEKTLYTV